MQKSDDETETSFFDDHGQRLLALPIGRQQYLFKSDARSSAGSNGR
jgi:hypothetical protein